MVSVSWSAVSLIFVLIAEPPPLEREKLRAVRDTAEALFRVQPPTCEPVAPGQQPSPQNVEAAVVYEQIAAMYGLTALRQPRMEGEDPEIRAATIGDKIDTAIQARIAAMRCLTGARGAHHLDAALDLLRVWKRRLQEEERIPEGSAAYVRVQQMAAAIEVERPPPPTGPPCIGRGKADCKQGDPVAPAGYARFTQLISLRFELGVAGGRMTFDDGDRVQSGRYLGPGMRTSLGVRLPVARHHVLILGGYFAWHHVSRTDLDLAASRKYRYIYAGGLQVEWGIRTAEGAFSVHPAVDLGAQSFFGDYISGQLRVGGAIGLCVANEIVCLISRGFLPAPGDTNDDDGSKNGIRGFHVNLGFDLFRAIDHGRARRTRVTPD